MKMKNDKNQTTTVEEKTKKINAEDKGLTPEEREKKLRLIEQIIDSWGIKQ
jgi:hypothetical protein